MIPLERIIEALQLTAAEWRPNKDQLLLEN